MNKVKLLNLKNIALLLSIIALLATTVVLVCLQNRSSESGNLDVKETITEKDVSSIETENNVANTMSEQEIVDALTSLNEYIKNIDVDNLNPIDLQDDIDEQVDVMATRTWIIDVVLINTNDTERFDEELAQDFNQRFNENIDNNFLSVHEFYDVMSEGNLNVWANIYVCNLNKPLSYIEDEVGKNLISETLLWEQARWQGNATLISENYGLVNAKCNILPCRRGTTDEVSWPHAYQAGPLMTLPYNKADVPTLCHESLHMLGLKDFYTNSGADVVATYDVMCETYNGNVSLNAYSRMQLGWLTASATNDSVASDVERIKTDGRYTLNVNTSSSGTIAFSFGNRNSDVFYVEYRKSSKTFESRVSGSGLLVYRINQSASGNLNYAKSGLYEMYVFSSTGYGLSDYNGYIKAGKSIGSATESSRLKLTYSDGSSSAFVISNIVENSNDTISFTISSNGDDYTQNGGFITANELKQTAVKTLISAVALVSGIVYNPVGTLSSIYQELLISIDAKINEIKTSIKASVYAMNEVVRTIQASYEKNIENGGLAETISNGIDYIKDGVQSACQSSTITSSMIVSQLQSIKYRLLNFLD